MNGENEIMLNEISEFEFIERIKPGCLIHTQNVIKGIGDDCAVFGTAGEELALVTADMLIERVHFLRGAISGRDLGHKSLAVNLSDIAAMGGVARAAFVSIGIPADCEPGYIDQFYEGMKLLASRFQVNILGGDTTGSKTDLIINVTVYGSARPDEILYRHTATPEDRVYITGFPGQSRAGLHLVLNSIKAESEGLKSLIRAHFRPEPKLMEGRFIALRKGAHAAIDVSDGISSDMAHIVNESGVGVRLYTDKIPVSDNLKSFCARFGFDPVQFAIAGGEDYELLFTAAPETAPEIERSYAEKFGRPLFHIGEITDTPGMKLLFPDGREDDMRPSGWDHFKQ